MSEPTIFVEIDNDAGVAYLQVAQSSVTRTEEFTPEINVDLDEFGMVVGIESLTGTSLFDETSITRLSGQYHVPSEVAVLLPVAIEAIRNFNQQSCTAVMAPKPGVLYSSNITKLTPCP